MIVFGDVDKKTIFANTYKKLKIKNLFKLYFFCSFYYVKEYEA